MKKTLLVILMFVFMYVVTGCDSLKGAKGDAGDRGDKGDTGEPGVTTTVTNDNIEVKVYTGTIPANGVVYIGSGVLSPSALVTVLYSYPGSISNVWLELGKSDNSSNPWVAVFYGYSAVTFYNCSTLWNYKIIVITDTSPAYAGLSTVDYIKGK